MGEGRGKSSFIKNWTKVPEPPGKGTVASLSQGTVRDNMGVGGMVQKSDVPCARDSSHFQFSAGIIAPFLK